MILSAASTCSIQAQAPTWPLDGAAFSAKPSEILAAAAKIAPEKFSQTTVLFEEEKDTLDGQGRLTATHRVVYRIETPAGVDSWSEAQVEWEAFYQNDPPKRPRVIRQNGSAVELDQKTVTDVPARNEDDGTYSDDRIRKAPLPALEVGAIVEQETTLTDQTPLFSGGGVYRNYFQRDVPVIRSRLIVEAPATLPLQYKVGFLPNVAIKDEQNAGIRTLAFDQAYLAPSVDSDIDLVTPQPRYPWVEFSTGKSWQLVADAYRALAEPQIQVDQVAGLGISRKVKPATSAQDRRAIIQGLVSRLHKEVRYTGIEFGKSKLQPQTPAEILLRHYGDCKDKAALLVAMLRASGIPANLALLNASRGQDVTRDLPGMNEFNHAIVYVPPANSLDKPLWIDATAEFTRVGDLPYQDQGRLALIIAEGTHDLALTPEARPEDSVLVETREFTLQDYGPSRAIENSATTGHIDAAFRSDYGENANKKLQTSYENYARTAYLAKALTSVEHGDPHDFQKPFFLRLEMAKALRGNTDLKEAAVALFPTGTYNSLPSWFAVDPDPGDHKLSPDEESDRSKAEQQRSAEYDLEPFISERRYQIIPPAGFVLRAMPADKTTVMGPASLTQVYTSDPAGVVTAVMRFNTGKGRYTTQEALDLRKAILQANKEDAVILYFDQAGAKMMAAGKVREALAIDRDLVKAHPKDALPHIRLANALLDAGVGSQARAEAIVATVLDPKSALAFKTLGWVLQFNMVGVRFGQGFDLNAGLAAYRKSKELDPEDLETRANLAILYEYDLNGTRYVSEPGLKSAIQEYRELKLQDKPAGERYQVNILFDMLYAHMYKELLAEMEPLPATASTLSLGIAATAALDGDAAAIQRADRISGDAAQRNTALRGAGSQLIFLRLYSHAAAILSAGLQGQEDAATIARQVEIFRNLQPYSQPEVDTDPAGVVRRMLAYSLSGNLTQANIPTLISRHAYAADAEWQTNLTNSERLNGSTREAAQRAGMTAMTLMDIDLGMMKISTQGDDATGYRITGQMLGAPSQEYFVVKEENGYRIVASGHDFAQVGNAALYFVHHGKEEQARALLDWKRQFVHMGGGDDPLDGPLFPRFWSEGKSKGMQAIELAAASLLFNQKNIAELLPEIALLRDHWTPAQGKPDQDDLNLLLAHGFVVVEDGVNAKKAAEALLKDYPDSTTATGLAGSADRLNHDWKDWNSMLDSRLANHPADRDLLSQRAYAAQAQGDFSAARKYLRAVLDSGQATSQDYNGYAWNALFENKVDQEAVQAGEQSTLLAKDSYPQLHTLACVYAAQDKTTEATQVLLQAMAAANLSQPNEEVWFAFGAIYEQYGELDAAIGAFRKVEKPKWSIGPADTYVLAQSHLKNLHALQ